ncbi:hypothetical protein ACGK9R_06385 [Halomonas sp. HNIBRBA4712]|uniref:hypothetical protein n=1 Tax=Halomonas sp. HNIBRBA4712 TaxID=3373087 RepID=UPI003745820E
MLSTPAPFEPTAPRRSRRCGLARWWLAGLLVSCLLPVTLSPASAAQGERAVTICLWVPAMLRVRSQRMAVRRRQRAFVKRPRRLLCALSRPLVFPAATPRVAALDVLTQRGPPR